MNNRLPISVPEIWARIMPCRPDCLFARDADAVYTAVWSHLPQLDLLVMFRSEDIEVLRGPYPIEGRDALDFAIVEGDFERGWERED